MRHVRGIALSLFASALGCSGTAEFPTFGGRGDPYDTEYNRVLRQHLNVRRNLEARGRNLYGARLSMESILSSLEAMKAMVAPADQPLFDRYLERYREFHKRVAQDTWGGSFLTEFDQSESEIRTRLHPDHVQVVAEPAPPPRTAARAAPPPPPLPRESSPEIPADKVEVPSSPARPAPPPSGTPGQPGPSEKPKAPPPPVPPPPAAPAEEMARLLYRSWDHSHGDLVETYRAKKDCRPKYDDLKKSLDLLKAQIPRERAERLQVYIACYAGIHERTRGFTVLPDKATEKEVADELNVVATWIRRDFNPDR
jgi:hypothetical protein